MKELRTPEECMLYLLTHEGANILTRWDTFGFLAGEPSVEEIECGSAYQVSLQVSPDHTFNSAAIITPGTRKLHVFTTGELRARDDEVAREAFYEARRRARTEFEFDTFQDWQQSRGGSNE